MKTVVVSLLIILSLSFVAAFDEVQFTEEQRAWLKEHDNTLIVGIEEDYPPFVSASSQQVRGLSIDYLRLIAGELNIRIKYSEPSSLLNLFNEVKESKIDMITSLTFTPERADFLSFTKHYVEVPAGVFSSRKQAINLKEANQKELRVAVGEGYGVQSFLENTYPQLNLVLVKNDLEALRKIQSGEADLAVLDLGSASYIVEQNNLTKIYFIGKSGFDYKLSFAFSKESEVMIGAFNIVMDELSLETKKEVEEKWFTLKTLPFYLSQTFFFIVVSFVFAMVFLVYIYQLWKKNNR